MKFISCTNRNVSGTGNGGDLQPKHYKESTDTFVDDLGNPIATVEGNPFGFVFNDGTPAKEIAVGGDNELRFDDGFNPEVTARIGNTTDTVFEIVDARITDFPAIPWFNAGSVFHAANRAANDVAGTIPCELHETDAVLGSIGSLGGVTATGSGEALTMSQATTSRKPRLTVDANGYVCMEVGNTVSSSAKDIGITTANGFTNQDYLESAISCSVGHDVTTGSDGSIQIMDAGFFQYIKSTQKIHLLARTSATTFVDLGPIADADEKFTFAWRLTSNVANHGQSEFYVNDTLVGNTNYVVSGYSAGDSQFIRANVPHRVGIKVYGIMPWHEGALTPAERTSVNDWLKTVAGIA